jgi:5-methylcytosine-specific restriction enzyme A
MRNVELRGKSRNPAWTREELILALELYKKLPKSRVSAKNAAVIQLSTTLNKLRSTVASDPVTYRNPNGVAMKLHNFGRFDPGRGGVALEHGNRLEKAVWDEFHNSHFRLSEEAEKIRSRVSN